MIACGEKIFMLLFGLDWAEVDFMQERAYFADDDIDNKLLTGLGLGLHSSAPGFAMIHCCYCLY